MVLVLVDVRGCDVKLLLGRITFDLLVTEKILTLWESLSCPAHSNRQHASSVFHLFPDPSLFVFTTVILPRSPRPLSISRSCAVQLYCGPTQAFTQYIKLN